MTEGKLNLFLLWQAFLFALVSMSNWQLHFLFAIIGIVQVIFNAIAVIWFIGGTIALDISVPKKAKRRTSTQLKIIIVETSDCYNMTIKSARDLLEELNSIPLEMQNKNWKSWFETRKSELEFCWISYINVSLFKALGQWGRSKKRAGDERDQRRAGSGLYFSLPDPARRPAAFSIVPTDTEPGAGYINVRW